MSGELSGYSTGVKKKSGSSSAATRISMSRNSTSSDASARARPLASATTPTAIGIASHSVPRTRGRSAKFRISSPASITANDTRCVATIDSGTSWRGKRVFRIRFALSSIDRDADWTELEKKIHAARPTSKNSP